MPHYTHGKAERRKYCLPPKAPGYLEEVQPSAPVVNCHFVHSAGSLLRTRPYAGRCDRNRSGGGRGSKHRKRTRKVGQPVRTAAFFDLDKTVIAKSSTLAFSKPFFDQGLINRRAVLKSTYAQFLFLMSGADHDQMDRMRNYITNMCTGWDVDADQIHRRRDTARHRRSAGVRRGRQSDRRPQAVWT